MKTTDERITEIFRRSEIIFKKRQKRRKRILAVCLPMLLCVTLCLTIIGQFQITAKNDSQNPANPSKLGNRLMLIEVSGSGIDVSNGQTEVLLRVQQIFDDITAKPDTDIKINDYISSSSVASSNCNQNADYQFILTNTDGHVAKYELKGCVFIDLSTDEEYTADPAEVMLLLQILGISENN